MGMFDSLYDENEDEWQTKAFHCVLSQYSVGDTLAGDFPESYPTTYQVEILGGPADDLYTGSLATVRDEVLVSINDPRDKSLPLLNYSGHLISEGI